MKRVAMFIAICCSAILIAIFMVFSPLIFTWSAQSQTIAVWKAPFGIWGIPKQIYVKAERVTYSMDPFGIFGETQLPFTDGGYAYILDRNISARDIETVEFIWDADNVHISFESGNVVAIPKGRIIEQID